MGETDYRPAYNLLRDLVAEHGGSMEFVQEGEGTGGSWLISVAGKRTYFPCQGQRFPGIDELHVRKPGLRTNTWEDFINELLPNAWELLLKHMNEPIYGFSSDPDALFDDLIED